MIYVLHRSMTRFTALHYIIMRLVKDHMKEGVLTLENVRMCRMDLKFSNSTLSTTRRGRDFGAREKLKRHVVFAAYHMNSLK